MSALSISCGTLHSAASMPSKTMKELRLHSPYASFLALFRHDVPTSRGWSNWSINCKQSQDHFKDPIGHPLDSACIMNVGQNNSVRKAESMRKAANFECTRSKLACTASQSLSAWGIAHCSVGLELVIRLTLAMQVRPKHAACFQAVAVPYKIEIKQLSLFSRMPEFDERATYEQTAYQKIRDPNRANSS